MSRLLTRLGHTAAVHPWRVIAGWLVALVLAVSLAAVVGDSPHDDYTVAGSPSQAGADFITERFGDAYATDARVVVRDPDGSVDPSTLDALSTRLADLPHVVAVDPPRLSADGDTALLSVRYDVPVTDFAGSEAVDALWSAADPTRQAGLQVALGGQVPENFAPPSGTAELVGVLVALLILVFAFGSVVAAGLPMAVALVGLGVGSSLITLLAAVTDVSTVAPTIATMVGIGVGIDYALLLVTRFVEGLRSGLPVPDAAARANGTAGVSVVFAGTTVLVSLFGLRLADLPTYTTVGVATLLVVLSVMLTSITLVPALCGLVGHRVLGRRARRGASVQSVLSVPDGRPAATARWARRVGRQPWPWALGALALLLVLAAPVLGMRTWPQDAGSQPESNTTRIAYDLVADEYGPGANGSFLLAVDLAGQPGGEPALDPTALTVRLSAEPGVASVAPPVLNRAGDAALIVLQPTTGPQDEATTDLLMRLRADLPESVHVTGLTAVFSDISDRLADRLWVVIAFVVGVSLLLLTAAFRSVVVSVKAAALNLLSVAAAYGVMVAVFQWGWGAELLGLPHAVPISSWVPILMFTILFGLSMDYQVFLLSRIREDYLATGDPRGSVIRGVAGTGRVITCAAAIMIAVFVGFGLDADPVVKMMGVGMAVAVLIDATVVRMVLVPATMSILGRANWWLPRWLDRVLPHLDTEGSAATRPAPNHPADPQPAPAGAA
ncbi:MAG TPA: MMPL family transporter [Nakamurella sp.]